MRLFNYKSVVLAWVALSLFVTSCQFDDYEPSVERRSAADFDHSIVTEWDELFLEIERYADYYRPGPAPRALAYIGLASYEACIGGMPDHESVAWLYPGLNIPKVEINLEYHWPTVVNASRAFLLRRFFSETSTHLAQKIDHLESANDQKFREEVSADVFQRSKAHGEAVASTVWEWSKTDHFGHNANLNPFGDYNWQDHYNGPGDWQATYPGPGKPLFPYWGQVRTFAIAETDKLCPPPFPYSESTSSPLFTQAMEVYAQTVDAPYENVWIAEFWSDDFVGLTFSPGSRWIAIAIQVYEKEKASLQTALYSDAKIGMALNDAAVACWHSKYVYNVERPISYIQRMIDPNWNPILFNPLTNESGLNPSFPAYPSGHSTMGASAAEVLTDIFGINYPMTDHCHENRFEFEGRPRSFGSFYEMAEENAWSRLPLGVHFRMDSEQGVKLGYRCGRKVNNLPWKK
jgi:hypothetical protein